MSKFWSLVTSVVWINLLWPSIQIFFLLVVPLEKLWGRVSKMCSLTPGAFTCTCIIVLLQDADPNTEIFCEISDPFQPLWTVCTISASCCAFCLHTHGLLSLFLDPRPLMTFSTFRSPLSLHCTIRPFPSSLPLVSQSEYPQPPDGASWSSQTRS